MKQNNTANARKWKHENGGKIEKHGDGKIIQSGLKRIVSPVVSRRNLISATKHSLGMQRAAEIKFAKDPLGRQMFWYGKEIVPKDIIGASYFLEPAEPRVFGRTIKVVDTPGLTGALSAQKYDGYPSKSAAIADIPTIMESDYGHRLKTVGDVMKKLSGEMQDLESGSLVALVTPEALSIDSYPLYLRLLQRNARNGKGVMEPVLDGNQVFRMMQLNDYGVGGLKSLHRIDNILKDLRTTFPNLPERVTLPGNFNDSGYRFNNYFVPAFKYTHFKNGGKF